MAFQDMAEELDLVLEIAKCEKSLLNKFRASIEAGHLFHLICIPLDSERFSAYPIIQEIRSKESSLNLTKKT